MAVLTVVMWAGRSVVVRAALMVEWKVALWVALWAGQRVSE